MQGAIFTALADMCIERFGMPFWHGILIEAAPASGGAYTSSKSYPDAELYGLLGAVCRHAELDVATALNAFGHYIFPVLMRSLPPQMVAAKDLFSFIESIERVIHFEVRRLNPDAQPPLVDCARRDDRHMTVYYQSPRKLCALAEALLEAAARHFGEDLHCEHRACMHQGAERCEFALSLGPGQAVRAS